MKAIGRIGKIIYMTIIVIMIAWVLLSWWNIITNNSIPGMSENIWAWNFFRVMF